MLTLQAARRHGYGIKVIKRRDAGDMLLKAEAWHQDYDDIDAKNERDVPDLPWNGHGRAPMPAWRYIGALYQVN